VDEGGDDVYSGVFVPQFLAPANLSAGAGSAGFGANGATGVFLDRGNGQDAYVMLDERNITGQALRGNDVIAASVGPPCVPPSVTAAAAVRCVAPNGSNGGQGAFIDR
jgi:hypothetical protein